jgi:PAS domain S-box-containing protein
VSFQTAIAKYQTMKAIQRARGVATGKLPKLCHVYDEALDLFIEATDPETGFLKPQPPVASPLAPTLLIPADLPVFSVDGAKPDDAMLYRLMDESRMMLWAATPQCKNLHCTPALLAYGGQTADEMRELGWATFVHPLDRAALLNQLPAAYKTRQRYRVTYRYQRHDGVYGLILDIATPRYRADGSFAGYIGTMHEVMERAVSLEILGSEPWSAHQILLGSARPAGPS